MAFQHPQNVSRQQPVDNTPITSKMIENLKEMAEACKGDEKNLMNEVLQIYEGSDGTRVQKWNEVG